MKMYIIDIGGTKENLSDEYLSIAEQLFLHRDLIRGYTLNRTIILKYYEFMESVIGKYVIPEIFEYDVPDGLTEYEYDEKALMIYNDLVEEGLTMYASTCPELKIYKIDNGDFVISTEPMLEYSCELFMYEDILYKYILLNDDIFNYVIAFTKDDDIRKFSKYILDGIPSRLYDLFDEDGVDGFETVYTIDPYGVFKWYITTLQFIY